MPDIPDGESVEMQGSGAKPYILKNVGGVYSCTCPAWRNQSTGIERRTCKHLRKYRGDEAEEARLGGALPAKPAKQADAGEESADGGKQEPPLLLAESWDNSLDLAGWWMSEKLDGVRAYWDGRQFLSRQGNLYHAPDWFIEGLPNVPLDGELWIDRKAFQRTVSIVRRQDKSDHWKTVRYIVFDAPAATGPFEARVDFLKQGVREWKNSFLTIHEHCLCRDVGHLREELGRIESLGGEGLMLRQPESKYASGRSATLLKVKTFYDAEATVVSHEPGKGRHQGRLGALSVQFANGKKFSIGTGFSDKEREHPPVVGSLVTFRYQELSDAGIPRFPSYVGLRSDVAPTKEIPSTKLVSGVRSQPAVDVVSTPAAKPPSRSSEPTLVGSRYFEFVEGKSSKFWEIGTVGNSLTTRWGRIGTKGQSKTKKFSSAEEAWAERNSAIQSKLDGGYHEIECAPPNESVPELDSAAFPSDSGAQSPVAQLPVAQSPPTSVDPVSVPTNSLSTPAATAPEKYVPPTIPKHIEQLVWAHASAEDSAESGRAAQQILQYTYQIEKLSPQDQIEVVKARLLLARPIADKCGLAINSEDLLKNNLPFTDSDIEFLAGQMQSISQETGRIDKFLLAAIEKWSANHPLPAGAREKLRTTSDHAEEGPNSREVAKRQSRIDALLGEVTLHNPIKRRETWAVAAIDDVKAMPAPQRAAWIRLLHHCSLANSGKPSAAWTEAAEPLIAEVTRDELAKQVHKWFPLVDKPWNETRDMFSRDPLFMLEANQDILRGLVWCCSRQPDPQVARALGALGISAYRKIPRIGARGIRVGNACVFALGTMADLDAVAQLAILKVKVKFGTAQRFIEAELDKAAERLNLPREELEEMSVPAYGLDEVGLRQEVLGDFTAELRVSENGKTELRWLKADGTLQKSIPAAVQKEFDEEVKDLKAAVKDIDKMLPIQRERIDNLFLQSKVWPIATWRDRFLNHPLVGTIARRLIWRFHTGDSIAAGIFHNGALVDCDDRPLAAVGEGTTVELWHPLSRPVDEVTAWRGWLERHEVQQPFKQAHREIYVLTDAEQRTRVYSNRFAAHILRQTQFRALASSRGWQTQLLGYWDGGDSAKAVRRLPRWDLVAEFWILGLSPEDNEQAGDDRFASAGMPHISTDQVRFCRTDESEPMDLSEVPPLVFSEIMRDVDLFVGVASVGNDPNWVDGGGNRRYADYWHQYSLGELSATARTRKDVLERLIPRLKIADRCSLSDRFLVVRGELRTYKIHLGSGNILMSPNDEYLCIVPKPSSGESSGGGIFLPFEGDRMLSIILSKVFLLADDKKIKDSSITRQITMK